MLRQFKPRQFVVLKKVCGIIETSCLKGFQRASVRSKWYQLMRLDQPNSRPNLLNSAFFGRDSRTVARRLLGKKLIRQLTGIVVSGLIVETEAYFGRQDSASHAFKGRTPRNAIMFGPPGMAYIYLIYGLHHMLNVVTEADGTPGAVLIRAVEPLDGQQHMAARRGGTTNLTNGPGRLCQAFAVDRSLNGWDYSRGSRLWLEDCQSLSDEQIAIGPRVGIDSARPAERQAPWRFWIKDNPYVSASRARHPTVG